MKMRDFFGAYDCFFSTIKDIKIYFENSPDTVDRFTIFDYEMVDVICHIDEWFFADYEVKGFQIQSDILYIICRKI